MVRNPFANLGDVRDTGLIPRLGRSPGGGHGNPLQNSCLENPMARGAYKLNNQGWMKHKLESTLHREIIITSDMQMTPLLWKKEKRN